MRSAILSRSKQATTICWDEICWDSNCQRVVHRSCTSPRVEVASNAKSLKLHRKKKSSLNLSRNKYDKNGAAHELDTTSRSLKVLSSKEWKDRVLTDLAETGEEDPYKKVVFKSRNAFCQGLDHKIKCRDYSHDPHMYVRASHPFELECLF